MCRSCDTEKLIADFNKAKARYDGLQPYCRKCQNDKVRKKYHEDVETSRAYCLAKRNKDPQKARDREKRRYWDNPEKESARKQLAFYGLTIEARDQMLFEQAYRCACCGTSEPGGVGTWHTDHDHSCCPGRKSCGKCVRGLVCCRCNHKLSTIEDPIWMGKAQNYLERYKQSGDATNG